MSVNVVDDFGADFTGQTDSSDAFIASFTALGGREGNRRHTSGCVPHRQSTSTPDGDGSPARLRRHRRDVPSQRRSVFKGRPSRPDRIQVVRYLRQFAGAARYSTESGTQRRLGEEV
jgi:hypothetical protein